MLQYLYAILNHHKGKKMLKVRIDYNHTARMPMCNGTYKPATVTLIDTRGNLYAMLTSNGQIMAWDCNPEHDAVECELIHDVLHAMLSGDYVDYGVMVTRTVDTMTLPRF